MSTSTTDENIAVVKTMILNNRRITIRKVADDVGISFGSRQAIFMDVLLLNFEQKERCMYIAQEILTTFDLLKNVITGDVSWVDGYVIAMEASRRAKTEKSTSSSVKCEGFAHCFLRLQ